MIFQIAYQLIWYLVLLLTSPIYFYRLVIKGKYRQSTWQRMGFQDIPDLSNHHVIWMHSVSLGESQISDQFAKTIKDRYPATTIVASSCTETGQEILEKSPYIDFSFYYPADLPYLVSPIFKKLKPKAILIMETDLWPNMLAMADKKQVPVYILNAKISENSFKIYQRFPFIKKRLMNPVHFIYSQCQSYEERFLALGVDKKKQMLLGNLKLDRFYPPESKEKNESFLTESGLSIERKTIVFASSHAGEEQGFIDVAKMLSEQFDALQFILVPRHPERFAEVASLLKKNKMAFYRYSERDKYHIKKDEVNMLLLDAMGVLMDAYAASDIAVVAGSFTDKVGGHNIFEPAHYAKAIIYGPWMYKQPGFHELIQERNAAIQITSTSWQEPLLSTLVRLLKHDDERLSLGENARQIIRDSQGISVQLLKDLEKRQSDIFAREDSSEETNI